MKKRILAILLMLCLVLALYPVTAFAEDGDAAIQLGTGEISGYDNEEKDIYPPIYPPPQKKDRYHYIYFGTWDGNSIKWRVLDVQTNTGADGLFLLSEKLLGDGTPTGGVYFDNTREPKNNAWQGSDAQKWCNDFYDSSFSAAEQGAVLATTKSDAAFTDPYRYFYSGASENILNNDKVFFLSAEEVFKPEYGFEVEYGFEFDNHPECLIAYYGTTASQWWIRSPYLDPDCHKCVNQLPGYVDSDGMLWPDWYSTKRLNFSARPAFNLNRDAVLFTSAAAGGKSSGAAGADALISNSTASSVREWKLTLKDSSRDSFSITTTALSAASATVSYQNAATGADEYISAVIIEKGAEKDRVTYYGRVKELPAAADASGEVTVNIPTGVTLDADTILYIFNEHYNGDYETDYASALRQVMPVYEITAKPETLDFGSKTVGYTIQPAAQTVTVKNTGNQNVTVTLPTSTNYTVTPGDGFANGEATLVPNGTAAFTVQPKSGLALGGYEETITISGSDQTSASVTAKFRIKRRISSSGSGATTVKSPSTSDAGITLYAGLALLSLTGGAWLRRGKNSAE